MAKNTKNDRDMRPLRQGDVMLIPIKSLPDGVKKAADKGPRVVCQYGEVTGHAHAVKSDDCNAFTDQPDMTVVDALATGARAFLEICYKAEMTHEEHAAIKLEAGVYEVKRQRQYTPERIILVAD